MKRSARTSWKTEVKWGLGAVLVTLLLAAVGSYFILRRVFDL